MPRKGEVPKRDTLPDPKYTDAPLDVRKRVTKFMNTVMTHGKKSTAEGIVYGAFDIIEKRSKQEPLKVFDAALTNVKPKLEVKSRRVGGSTYQVPVDVRPERSPGARHALAGDLLARSRREDDGREARRRDPRRVEQPRQRGEEEAKTRTRWRKRTRRSRTIAGSFGLMTGARV